MKFFEYLRETWCKHALEHLEMARSETEGCFLFLPAVSTWLLLTSLKACDWSGHIFGASASPRALPKKTGYVTLFHCSWRSARYRICDIRVPTACSLRGWRKIGALCLNQLICLYIVRRAIAREIRSICLQIEEIGDAPWLLSRRSQEKKTQARNNDPFALKAHATTTLQSGAEKNSVLSARGS